MRNRGEVGEDAEEERKRRVKRRKEKKRSKRRKEKKRSKKRKKGEIEQ
jgi:hypothetical protein